MGQFRTGILNLEKPKAGGSIQPLTTTFSIPGICSDGHYRATALCFPNVGEEPVTAKPGDEMAAAVAAGRGRLRASHADREHVLDVLKAAFVQGLLTKDEFDLRVGQTFASRTYGGLAALTADIPAGLIGPQSLRKPARENPHPENKFVNSLACASFAVIALAAALLTGNFGLFFVVAAVISGGFFAAGGRMVYSSHKNRSSTQQW